MEAILVLFPLDFPLSNGTHPGPPWLIILQYNDPLAFRQPENRPIIPKTVSCVCLVVFRDDVPPEPIPNIEDLEDLEDLEAEAGAADP